VFQDADRKLSEIFLRIEPSFWRLRGMSFWGDSNLPSNESIACAATSVPCDQGGRIGDRPVPVPPCTLGQGTGLHSLTLLVLKTGLTPPSTEISMSEVANQGSRLDFDSSWYSRGHQGNLPANVKWKA
jgi:hypothetical protein